MSKIKTFAEWVLALTRGYTKVTGKKPDKLSQLKINMEAGQKVKDQNKIIEVDFNKKKPWHEKKAGGGVAGLLGENHRVPYIEGGMTLKEVAEDTKIDNFIEYLDLIELMRNMEGTKFHDAVYKPRELEAAGGGLAGMLGEPTYADENHRVPFKGGKKVLEGLTKLFDEFFPGTTKIGKRSKPYPEKVQEKMDLRKAFENFNNKIATQEALSKGSKKMRGPIENVNKKSVFDPVSTDATTWLQQGKFFNPKALDMYGKKVPANWIEVEKKAAKKLIDDLGPLDVSPSHPNYKDMKAIRQSAKDRLASIKITEALGGNIQMHDWIRMNRKNIDIDDYIKKPGAKKVVDELSGIKKIMIKDKESGKLYEKGSEIDKSIQLEKKAEKMLSKMSDAEIELRSEFPGISDDLIKNILADDNPQRIAEVKAAMKEAMKMQEKGMGVEEIINIFKKKPTKHASGGLAGMLGE